MHIHASRNLFALLIHFKTVSYRFAGNYDRKWNLGTCPTEFNNSASK